MSKNRTDIQALRGLAVLCVVFYHAKIAGLTAGYLGVDIFFVISGFLITGLIKSAIERGDFRFSTFYFRRAKRLLPAAYVVFLVTALLAPFVLGRKELGEFALQMIGAVTFTGNIVLWQQTGYFQGAGELKPLLHVWSLSIEEQYYFILPATLVFISPRRWLPLALFILFSSLILCVIGGYLKPIATFYLLPTRGWELAIGSVGALIAKENWLYRLARVFFVPSLIALAVIPFVPFGGIHPGIDAFIVCVATLLVVLRNHPQLNSSMPTRLLARVGDFSYSLYLVHWPIFSFASTAWAGEPPGELPITARVVALMLSFTLAYLLYRFVERPIHKAEFRMSPRLLAKTFSATLGLALGTMGIARAMSGGSDFEYLRRTNYGFGEACEYVSRFESKAECRSSDKPSILVWGDSFAMHLVPGIVTTAGTLGIIQATRSNCGPLLDIAPMEKRFRKGYNRQWAEDCIAFNQSVVDYLATAPSVDIVVLSSTFRAYLDTSDYQNLQRQDGENHVIDIDADSAIAGLKRTVQTVRALGKRVVIVAPPPTGRFNIGSCLERRAEGRLVIGAPKNCEISVREYHQTQFKVRDLLARIPSAAGAEVISFEPLLCNGVFCKTAIDGVFVYRDSGHLSYGGSQLIAKRISLARELDARAH